MKTKQTQSRSEQNFDNNKGNVSSFPDASIFYLRGARYCVKTIATSLCAT